MFPVKQSNDDSALEDELAALLRGDENKSSYTQRREQRARSRQVVSQLVTDQVVGSEDSDVSDADENDAELLAELQELTAENEQTEMTSSNIDLLPTLLSRHEMYKVAEVNAKQCGETAKARRYGRTMKTLDGQIKRFKSGLPVSADDIPPPIGIGSKPGINVNDSPASLPVSAISTTVTDPPADTADISLSDNSTSNTAPATAGLSGENLPPGTEHTDVRRAVITDDHMDVTEEVSLSSDGRDDQISSASSRVSADATEVSASSLQTDHISPGSPRVSADATEVSASSLQSDDIPLPTPRDSADATEVSASPIQTHQISPATSRISADGTEVSASPLQTDQISSATDRVSSEVTEVSAISFESETTVAREDPRVVSSGEDRRSQVCGSREEHPQLAEVRGRRAEYLAAALQAKQEHNKQKALQCIQIIKVFDSVLEDMIAGRSVDLSDMPDSPSIFLSGPLSSALSQSYPGNQTSSANVQKSGLESQMTLEESLLQRLRSFQEGEESARQSGNVNKARRCRRICQQYEQAISRYRAAMTVDLQSLPTPHGFPPLSEVFPDQVPSAFSQSSRASDPDRSPAVEKSQSTASPAVEKPQSSGSPAVEKLQSVSSSQRSTAVSEPTQKATNQSLLREKQLSRLELRRKQFMEAALGCKKAGDMELARTYLRHAKGFERLVTAVKDGQSVDLNSLPVPPQLQKSSDLCGFEVISRTEVQHMEANNNQTEVFTELRSKLLKQAKFCQENSSHFKVLGDVQQSQAFLQLQRKCATDLQALQTAFTNASSSVSGRADLAFSPKIHYETREFQIVQACSDLRSDELELVVVQGINYSLSSNDVETYVKWEFPWPTDAPSSGRSGKARGAAVAPYNSKFVINIDRTSRPLMRIFRRQSVKLEVWQKGRLFGWTDQLVGSVMIKLQCMSDKCLVHQAYDVMAGRRTVKGKLEVKLRMRTPMFSTHTERVCHNWLLIDAV